LCALVGTNEGLDIINARNTHEDHEESKYTYCSNV